MKRLFLLLCLLNLGFLLWQFHSGRLDVQLQQSVAPSSLLLVDEYERARRGAEIAGLIDRQIARWRQADIQRIFARLQGEESRWQKTIAIAKAKKVNQPPENKPAVKQIVEPAKIVTPVVEKKCFEVGPFTDELSVKQWLVKNALISQKTIQKDSAVPSDYQVYYPAAQTPEQSRINKLMLNAKGLQDIWLIPSGDNKGAYSLGVFKDKQRALVFKTELSEKGIQAQIKQREKTVPEWFARVMLDKTKLEQYRSAVVKLSICSVN